MNVITLSDYISVQKSRAQAEREKHHDEELQKHFAHVERLKEKAKNNIFWRIYRAIVGYPAPPRSPELSGAEQALLAGSNGEDKVADWLIETLPPTWTVLRGYSGKNGEIDLVLVSDQAVFCIEVKNVNGLVEKGQDGWTRQKIDAYGNIVGEPQKISDRRGRSPLEQVQHSAKSVQWIFDKRDIDPNRVHPIVVMTHSRSKLSGDWSDQPVYLMDDLHPQMFQFDHPTMRSREINHVISTLRKDHAYWERKRGSVAKSG